MMSDGMGQGRQGRAGRDETRRRRFLISRKGCGGGQAGDCGGGRCYFGCLGWVLHGKEDDGGEMEMEMMTMMTMKMEMEMKRYMKVDEDEDEDEEIDEGR